MITSQEVHGSWNSFLGGVRKKYAEITGDDLEAVKGNIQQMAGVIQKKTGQAREEIETYLQSLSSQAAGAADRVGGAASHMASSVNEGLRDGYDYVADKTQAGFDSARESVRKKPVEMIAVVFGVGMAIGLLAGHSLFGRRRD